MLYLQYGVYDSPSPSTFIRASPNGDPVPRPSLRIFQNYRLDECLSIVLKSEIGHGATGKVLRGTLSVEASSACVLLDIVVKFALGSERGAALRDEYKIYHLLRKSGVTAGITTPLGLFDDVEGGVSALVMPYVGTPLAAMPEFVLTRSYQCSTFLSHYHPPFLTPCGQGSRFGEFKGNTYSRRTPWRSSFGQHTCGRFGSHNYRFRSIPSVL